jgi:hypothetical protein
MLQLEEHLVPPEDQQEFCPHLYDDLRERLRAKDQERAIELTYRLICSGRPLGEIIAQTAPVRASPEGGQPEIAPTPAPLSDPAAALPQTEPLAAVGGGRAKAPNGDRRAPATGSALAPARHASLILGDVAVPSTTARHRSGGWRPARRVGFLLAYSLLLIVATILGLPLLHRTPPAWFAAAEPSAVAAPTPAVTVPIAPAAAPRASPSGEQRPAAAPTLVAASARAAAPPPAVTPTPHAAAVPGPVAAATPVAATSPAAPPGRGPAPPVAAPHRPAAHSATLVPTPAAADRPKSRGAPSPAAVAAAAAMPAPATSPAAPPGRGPAPPVAAPHPPAAHSAAPVPTPAAADRPKSRASPSPAAVAAAAAKPAAPIAKPPDMPPAATRDGPPAAQAATAGRSEIATELLVARGDALLGTADLAGARLFYRRGADRGDGTAALRLGETFDPAFLRQAGLGVVAGDAATAFYWYRRARDLGNGDADLLLQNLQSARR